MTTAANQTPWPRIVRRYTFLLVALVTLLGAAITGFVYWSDHRADKSLRVINDFHLKSAFTISDGRREVEPMLTHVGYTLAGIEEAVQNRAMGQEESFNMKVSFYFLQTNIARVLKLQRRFAEPKFAFLTERLERQFAGFEKSGITHHTDKATALRTVGHLQSLMVTLTQLERLHTISYGDLLAKHDAQQRRNISILFAFIVVVLLVGYLSMRRGLLAIDGVVERQRAAEEELLAATLEAESANRAKSEFLANMSHDLRTPLNAIIGFSDMMRAKVYGPLGDPRYEGYADDIKTSGELLVSLIDDILDLSKIGAGRYDLAEENLDIPQLVQVSFRQLSNAAEAANQTLTADISADLPGMRGDKKILIQLFNNLLSNAIKYTPDGGKVEIAAKVDDANAIVINVTDTGIGIPQSDIAMVLSPFRQSNAMLARTGKGTGLGLFLSANFMKLFGGTLKVESEVGKGTTITLNFPSERTILPA